MTSGSAFMRANGSRSDSRQGRKSRRGVLKVENSTFQGDSYCVSAVRCLQLREDVLNVDLYRAAGRAELLRNLFVAQTSGHKAEHFHFTPGESGLRKVFVQALNHLRRHEA